MAKTWEERQAANIYKTARAKWGDGWDMLGRETKEAFVNTELVHLLIAQDEEFKNFLQKIADVHAHAQALVGVEYGEWSLTGSGV